MPSQALGGKVVRNEPAHGKTSWIRHDNSGVLAGSPTRRGDALPLADRGALLTSERSGRHRMDQRGTVMGLRHHAYPTYGVQFHRSRCSRKEGKKILSNFIRRAARSGMIER